MTQPYKDVFEKMEQEGKFPPYVYKEYPKWVKLKNGKEIIVNSHVEELRAIDEIVPAKDIVKLEADKGNLEKLLAESQARLEELKKELEAGKHPPEPSAPPAPLVAPVPPTKPSAPNAKAS